MPDRRTKDPDRVRTGRMGALSIHSRGLTNTGPARAAVEAKLAAEVDPDRTLTDEERARRVTYLRRLRMIELARRRWNVKGRAA